MSQQYKGDELIRRLMDLGTQAWQLARTYVVRPQPCYHAERCPVCNGSRYEVFPSGPGTNPANTLRVSCQSCIGKGWVEVRNG